MSERFTRHLSKFEEEIQRELETSINITDHSVKLIFTQFSVLPYDRFAIHYVQGSSSRLLIKSWDNEYDNGRFRLGVYNLDRIAIKESIIHLTHEQTEYLDRLIILDYFVKPFEGILLDGYRYSLKLKATNNQETNIEWQHYSQISNNTKQLVEFLRQAAGI